MDLTHLKAQTKVHFIGLGGIGMSALALILRELQIPVQGSDLSENYLTQKLRDKGILYFVSHKKENISSDVSLVVKTSIVKDDNPEILEAKARGIEIITRANLLAILMKEKKSISIAGTHGKTSTTAMVSMMLEIGELDPTVINGGVIHYFGSNSKIGKGEYLVAESDESDGSFVTLPSFIGAVTNIEPEHLEFYGGSFEKQKSYFEKYMQQIPENGLCVVCIDDVEVEKLYKKLSATKKNFITYSLEKDADLVATNISIDASGTSFDVKFKDGREIKNVKLSVYGKHNASNALVAIAISDFLKIPANKIREAFAAYSGVKRRFTKVGEYNGAAIIDDYGHHPTEIKTTLKAAREIAKNHQIISVFQAHKYTRVHDLFKEFCGAFSDADYVIVCDVYSAGQAPIAGATQDDLVEGIKKSGHKNVIKLSDEKDLAKIVKSIVKPSDIIICTGAGSITYIAAKLENQLKELN